MPLVRYEIRNEYSLASSELYKKAAKDDPEGLLEGVAMAGLVGIVRQLGDLAEFATEVFHDLHEEVMATAARGHSLLIRVQQLEAELPGVEKCLFSDTNQIQCSYASEWHASIRNDQNHLTQGDLPWFIRNSYEECRGPPRLFLLDKFDIAGDGACLKRYTDPSFFKMEWANSELMKAEREQQDRKARRMKRKGRRRRNGEIDEAIHASQVHSRRYSSLEEDNGAGMLVSYVDNTEPQLGNEDDAPTMHKVAVNDHLSADSSKETFTYDGDILQPDVDTHKWNGEVCRENPGLGPLKISALDRWAEEGMPGKFVQADHTVDLKGKEEGETQHKLVQSVGDDVASDAEQFVDALATMESEVETDTESRVKMDVDSDFNSEPTEGERHVSLNDPFSKNNDVVYEETFNADKYLPIQPPDESSAPFTKSGHVWSPASSANAVSNSSLDKEESSSSIDENDVSPPTGKHDFSPPFDENNSFPISEYHLEAGNVDHLSETPPHSERDDHKDMQSQDLAASFHVLPDPAIPLVSRDENGNSGDLGSLSLLEQANAGEIFTEGAGGFPEKSNVSDELENGLAKSPVEFSSHSMVESTIALHLKVNTESSKSQEDSVDTDDELDGMQVSSISTSSSPSTVSTPHRSLLATTEFHMDSEGEPNSPLSSQFHMVSEVEPDSPFSSKSSIESSPKSPIFSVLHSPISPVKLKPIFSPSSEAKIQSLHSELLAPSSPTLSPEFITEFTTELEELPPPPPLPPLEWRIVRPRQNSLPSVAKAIEPPPPPALPIPPMAIEPPPPPALPVPPMAIEPPPPPALPVPPIRPDRVSQDPIPPVPPIRPGRISQDPIPPVPPAVRPEKGLQDPVPFVAPLKLERRDSLIEAIAFHGKGMLKKVTQQNRSPRTKPLDDREVLLEQIRTRSFNLRHTVVEKHEAPRPMTNINVAAILEKANAIRQAFAGSDEDEEDDDWSDT